MIVSDVRGTLKCMMAVKQRFESVVFRGATK